MSEKKSWSKDEVFSLISKWKLYPELWNANDEYYRSKAKKQNALRDLATAFNTNEFEINRKLHNMRTQFHQETRRIKAKKSGDFDYQSSWQYFDEMKFISSDLEKDKEVEIEAEDSEVNESIDQEKKTKRKSRRKCNETKQDDLLNKAVHIMYKPADEFQIFGDFVAAELRNLKSREQQRQLKLTIQRAIIQFSETDEANTKTYSSGS